MSLNELELPAMSAFERVIIEEINRLDKLFMSDKSALQRASVSSTTLEYPGLAAIASRSANVRRAALASIIEKVVIDTVDVKSVTVFANGTAQLLSRDLLAVATHLKFGVLDSG